MFSMLEIRTILFIVESSIVYLMKDILNFNSAKMPLVHLCTQFHSSTIYKMPLRKSVFFSDR